jgi:glutaredoxin 3
MASITIYTKPTCPYCIAAKALLRDKGASFNEISIEGDLRAATSLSQRSGRHTVPQIYIGEYHVGGYDDLKALEDQGRLDALLGRVAESSR